MPSAGGDWKDFYEAAARGDVVRVRYRLSEGVDPNYQHPEVMYSALVTSIQQQHAEVVLCLLEHGADPNLPAEFDGLTPLLAARQQGVSAIENALLAHGAHEPAKRKRPPFWQRWLPV